MTKRIKVNTQLRARNWIDNWIDYWINRTFKYHACILIDESKLGSPMVGRKMKGIKEKNNLMDKIESAFCRIERLHMIKALETIINMAERGEEVSANTVAVECMVTPRQARYWLKYLEELGYLIGSKKVGTKGGLFVYQLSEKAKAQADKIRTFVTQRKAFLEKVQKLEE